MTKEKIVLGAGLAALALVAASILVLYGMSPSLVGAPDQGLVTRPPETPIAPPPQQVLPAPQQVQQTKSETTKFENTISVSGTGVAKANPDRVLVALAISEEAKTAQLATESAATIFNKLLATLAAEGISRNDVQTNSINLNPVYFYPERAPPVITGYRLDHSITVTIKSQDTTQLGKQAGKVIDVAIAAGVTRINGISFAAGDESIKVLRTQALKAAIEDAKDKANTMANALGVKIVGVSSVSESVFIPVAKQVFRGEVAAPAPAAPPTELVPGEFQVTVNVYVVYGISG
ncbi:MAG: SIMPL domain-containing protein [Thaumarchaeota archaeon]|nr:SIMPL domain-containing protein [Nitrososphaerota archaeon]